MVSPGGAGGRDRAQLVLAGAIVLALLVLVLVTVFNGVFGAGSASNGGPPEVDRDEETVDAELRRGARRIAVRTAHRRAYATAGDLATAYREEFRRFRVSLSAMASQSRSQSVVARVNLGAPGTRNGTRIVQNETARFDRPAPGSDEWFVVPPGRRTELGWFAARVDATNLSRTDRFVVRVTNGSGTTMRVSVRSDDATNDVRVRVTGGPLPGPRERFCEPRSGQVVLDLYRGRSASEDCSFPGLRRLDGPVSVRFENGSAIRGRYELVVADPGDPTPGYVTECLGGPSPASQPCTSPALWQLSVTTRIEDGRATYVNRGNVTVYGGGS